MNNIWVISGAGARGSWECGVMSELWDSEGKPDHLIGCSAGALNAAGFACIGPTGTKEAWLSINSMADVFCNRYDVWSRDFYLARFSSAPLLKLIKSVMASPATIPFSVLYSDLMCVKAVVEKLPTPEHVLASASIPGVVPPVEGRYADGGLFHIAPLDPAVEMVGDQTATVTVILGSALNPKYSEDWKPKTVIDVGIRALDAMTDQTMREDVEYNSKNPNLTIRLIQPPGNWSMGTLEFTPSKIRQALTLGGQWRSYNGK